MLLSDKYPFLTNFFENAIGKSSGGQSKLAQSIVLYGNDLDAQYTLALEIARLLNCIGDKSDDCQCLNCKWVREGTHPAVQTITRFNADSQKPKAIPVEVVRNVVKSLVISSDYHKVFIFCDKDSNEEDAKILGLNRVNFGEASANTLLKSTEEPFEKVTFIFLTRDKEDLISTIISRSQCFFVPAKEREEYSYSIVEPVINNYWDIERGKAFDVAENLLKLADENDGMTVLEQMQNYMLNVLKSNPKKQFLIDDMNHVELAKKEYNLDMRLDTIFDELCLKLIR